MFGLGPLELFIAMFFWVIPIALVVAIVVFFLKWMYRISHDISQIAKSMQNIETKMTRNE